MLGLGDSDATFGTRERTVVLVVAILASSLGFIDASVVPVALPAIRADLEIGFAAAQWIANAYTLFLSALILVGGAAGDRFGVRQTFGAGIALFGLASIGCATAWSAEVLIAFRAIQGIGAAIMVPGSLALIARVFPRRERGAAIGIWSTASGLAAAFGPILGGILIDTLGPVGWRVVFWINAPLAGVALFLLFMRIRPIETDGTATLDWIGGVLATLSLGAVAFGLTLASEPGGFDLPALLAIVAGIGVGAGFVLWQQRAAEPMVPMLLLRSRLFKGANLLTFFLYFALSGVLFFLPVTLIEAHGMAGSAAGLVFLPFTVFMALFARYAGGYADTFGPRLPIAVGSGVVALAFATLALAVAHHDYLFGIMPAMAVLGIGMGLVVAPLSTAVMAAASERLAGAASGFNNGVARIAALFAVAALGIVVSGVYAGKIDPATLSGGYGADAAGLSGAALAMRTNAMTQAFVAVALITAMIAALSAVIALTQLPGRPIPARRAVSDAR